MNWTPESERGLIVRGPGWWVSAAMLLALLVPVTPLWPGGALTVNQLTSLFVPVGFVWSALSLVAAEAFRRHAPDDPMTAVRAQPFSGAAIMGVGVALSAFAVRLRSAPLDVASLTKWSLWRS